MNFILDIKKEHTYNPNNKQLIIKKWMTFHVQVKTQGGEGRGNKSSGTINGKSGSNVDCYMGVGNMIVTPIH